jgi:hypothetical protein
VVGTHTERLGGEREASPYGLEWFGGNQSLKQSEAFKENIYIGNVSYSASMSMSAALSAMMVLGAVNGNYLAK